MTFSNSSRITISKNKLGVTTDGLLFVFSGKILVYARRNCHARMKEIPTLYTYIMHVACFLS